MPFPVDSIASGSSIDFPTLPFATAMGMKEIDDVIGPTSNDRVTIQFRMTPGNKVIAKDFQFTTPPGSGVPPVGAPLLGGGGSGVPPIGAPPIGALPIVVPPAPPATPPTLSIKVFEKDP